MKLLKLEKSSHLDQSRNAEPTTKDRLYISREPLKQ